MANGPLNGTGTALGILSTGITLLAGIAVIKAASRGLERIGAGQRRVQLQKPVRKRRDGRGVLWR